MLLERWDINSQKPKSDIADIKNLQWSPEYVFIPITKNITVIVQDRTAIINPGDIQITLGSEHITKIENGRVYNVLLITSYAVDERNGRLVLTLDPLDSVKGILVAGRPQSNDFLTLRLPTNKLYLIRKKGKIPDVLVIHIPYSSLDVSNSMKTRYVSINDDGTVNKIINEVFDKIYTITQKEKVKEDIKGLFDYHVLVQ